MAIRSVIPGVKAAARQGNIKLTKLEFFNKDKYPTAKHLLPPLLPLPLRIKALIVYSFYLPFPPQTFCLRLKVVY